MIWFYHLLTLDLFFCFFWIIFLGIFFFYFFIRAIFLSLYLSLSAITSTTISAIIKSAYSVFLHTCTAHTLWFVNCSNITKRTYFRHIYVTLWISKINPYLNWPFLFYQHLEIRCKPDSLLGTVRVKFVYRACLVTDIVPVFRIDIYNRKIFLFLIW